MRFCPIQIGTLCILLLTTPTAQTLANDIAHNSRVRDIVVVFKMHVDIGYTNWAEGVLQMYSNEMLRETLNSIKETSSLPEKEQFIWTLPAWPLKYMLEHCPGDLKAGLEQAIRDQRIVPHALPITYETEASDLENLVRGLSYASEINKKFGLPPARDAKLTDVPSHSRILPTILKNAGVDFLHLGCNPGSASPEVPTLFWWQGPDGSRLLTFYWSEYYGSGILPPADWPHRTWLAMIHTHENTGAPTPDEVAELISKAREEMPSVNIKIGRLSDFYDLLVEENPELPVVRGDMPDTWIHGYMSRPKETKLSKALQRETYDTEILNSQLKLWGATVHPVTSHIEKAVENMILYDEHTFGAAMSHGNQHKWTYQDEFRIYKSLGHYDFIEGTWIEKGNRIRNAEKTIVPLMKHQMKNLASSVSVDGKRIVVYNPLPWARSGRVTFFAGIYQKGFTIYGLKDPVTGKQIPVYEDHNLISFDADGVPSMGYKTYLPILHPLEFQGSLNMDRQRNVLENKYLGIQINQQDGTLISAMDKRNHRELVDRDQNYGFGEYLLERPGQQQIDLYNKAYIKPGAEHWAEDEMIRPAVPDTERVVYRGKCEKIVYMDMGNAVRATVFGKLDDPGSQQYLVTYTLYENQPYIEMVWGVDGKKPDPHPEAGWLAFPFIVSEPEYRLYRTGGIVDPATELVAGTNHDYYFLNTSMALHDGSGRGIGLNSPSSPGVSIDEPGLFRFSGQRDLQTGNVFVNLFNNQWGTNFTEWIEGSFSSRIYIWSYGAYDSEKHFITPAEETRVALKGVYYDGQGGDLAVEAGGISLDRKGILITAFKPNPEGDGMLLRLWEQAGNEGICRIHLASGGHFRKAYPCNLRNAITDERGISITDDSFQVPIKAHQPASFILK